MTSAPARTLTVRTDSDRELEMKPLDLRLIVRLFRYTRPYARLRNALAVLVVVRSIQLPILSLLIGWTMRTPIAGGNLWGLPGSATGTGVMWAVGAFAAWALFTQGTLHFRLKLAMLLGENVLHDLRQEMFVKLQSMPMSFFDKTRLGRLISRFTSDAEAIRSGVQDVLFVGIVNLGQMVVAAICMAWLDPALFSIVLLLLPVVWLINRLFQGRMSRVNREVQESFSRVTATIAESVAGIRVTQGFVRQEVNASMFQEQIEAHSEKNMDVARTNAQFNPLLELNNQVFIAAMLVVGGWRALHHQDPSEVGDLIVFFFLTSVFFAPVQALGTQYVHAMTAMAGAERVFHLLDLEPAWQDDPKAKPLPPIRGRVEFRDVSFGYQPDRLVLNDITFTAEPGQIVALVGHTGSGKTSIINLIAKFHLPTRGQLLIDGHDIMDIKGGSLHRQMGIVLQVNFLFTGTIMDNIRYGKPGASDAEVIEAALRLGSLDLLEALPEGLYTQVGERGSSMSLGQRQLVCLTRAMLADPRIMILDEATSSVDTMTEARIQQSLARLFEGRTCFVVAHRLSTIRHADLVLVLNQGWIVERGNHVQLLTTGGVYANLYRQFIRSSEA